MIISISRTIRIDVEAQQFAVERLKKVKGVKVWKAEKWFIKLDVLINYLVRDKFSRTNEELTLAEFVRRYKNEVNRIEQMLRI